MLKHKALLILLPLLSTTCLEAHFLWKVNTAKPSYLYGTVHSSDPAVRDLPVEVVEALKRSDSFHPELEFSPENMGRLTAAIFAGGTTDLEEELPPDLWERLQHATRPLGIPLGLLRKIPVRLAPLLLATPPGTDFNNIVDVQAYQLARENGLVMAQLESVDEQIDIFRDLDRESAILFLEESLKEWNSGFPSHTKILRFYQAGNLDALESFLDQEFARMDLPDLAEDLIDRRNRKMVNRLLPHLEKGRAFVAVGVGHMSGEEGIVALLRNRGYEITRVPLETKVQP